MLVITKHGGADGTYGPYVYGALWLWMAERASGCDMFCVVFVFFTLHGHERVVAPWRVVPRASTLPLLVPSPLPLHGNTGAVELGLRGWL